MRVVVGDKMLPMSIPAIPDKIAAALEQLKNELLRLGGDNFAGLILYGGLARGRFRPGHSDVNVLVLLHDASPSVLAAVAPALRAARRSVGVDPMLLTPAEVPRAAEAFPTKFLDIKNHHRVLAGEDPLLGLEVSREEVRRRTVQALRNLLMRLRHDYVAATGEPAALARVLTALARPLALELESLLFLADVPLPEDDRSAVVFAAVATAFGFPAAPLAQLAALRHGQAQDDLEALGQQVLGVLADAVRVAEEVRGPER